MSFVYKLIKGATQSHIAAEGCEMELLVLFVAGFCFGAEAEENLEFLLFLTAAVLPGRLILELPCWLLSQARIQEVKSILSRQV